MTLLKLLAGGAGAAAVGSLAALKFLPAPFIWIGLMCALCALVVVARARPMGVRLGALVAAGIALALSGVEAFLWIAHQPPEAVSRDYTPRPYVNDSVLGWRLVPNQTTHSVARVGDSILYNVTYTTDSLGHRVGFPDRGDRASPCALFVVCSFAFGEGVQDRETLPYRVGALTDGRVRAVNLGVPGYGAEHILARLESGAAADRLPCAPTHIIYQALPHHVVRAAGLVEFSTHGPRYTLGPEGALSYSGTSPPADPALTQRGIWFELDWQLRKARLYRLVRERQPPPGSLADLRLYLALVRRSHDLLALRYPRAEFHILAWSLRDFFAGGYDGFRDSLVLITPRVHAVRDILPDYRTSPEPYQIDRLDAHPNAAAYDLLARFVTDSILNFAASAPKPD